MPTIKQKKAAKALVENSRTKGDALREAGYSEGTAIKPSQVMESKGFKDALAEYGLTEELITCALVEDIQAKPKNRLGELRLGSEILKMKDEPETTINIHNYSHEQSKRIAERALKKEGKDS